MKMTPGFVALVCSTLIAPWVVPALAQDQTVKACRAEWQAHKADRARRRERSPKRTTFHRHSSFTDLTQRSA
jgi:hypothetical protein